MTEIEDMPVRKFLDDLNGFVLNEENLEGHMSHRGLIKPDIASEIVKELKYLGILDEYNYFNKTIDKAALIKDIETPHLSTEKFFTMGTIGEQAFFTKYPNNGRVIISKEESKEIWDKFKEKGLLDERGKVSKAICLLYQGQGRDIRISRLEQGIRNEIFASLHDKIQTSSPKRDNDLDRMDVISAVYEIIERSVPVTYKYNDGVAFILKSMKLHVVATKENGRARISVAGNYKMFSTLDRKKLSSGALKIFNFFSELSKKCEGNEEWKDKKQFLDIRVSPLGSVDKLIQP